MFVKFQRKCLQRPFFAGVFVSAIPHKDCATDASSDFLRDEGKNGENPLWIFEYFPEISRKICTQDACEKIRNRLWRKICKQMACKVVRRSLCGIAQDVFCRCQKTHPSNYNRVVGFCQPIFLGFGRFAV